LEYKALAAAEKGATMFLVPKGQSIVTMYKPVEKQLVPGVIVVVYETVRLSLESILRDRGYHVVVMEVTTIQEAYLSFTK
jgi:predicted S18 family serine protease